jgi:hypothetical protein
MGVWENGVWRWDLLWRRDFFVWEESLFQQWLNVLGQHNLTTEEDSWVWRPAIDDGFSVKSMYMYLESNLPLQVHRTDLELFAFRYIWKTGVPSKVSALVWQLLLNRIPTKDNLCYRGVVRQEDALCSICDSATETSTHLFLHCSFAASVWYAINRWLGVIVILPPSVLMSYAIIVGYGSNKKRKKGFSLVWMAYIWVMWKMRNDGIFNNKAPLVEDVVDNIQRILWQWYMSNVAKGPFLLYEWIWNPRDCMVW